ncbi:transmembrane protein 71 isoform 1-T4 [Guaruba guarouba]
MYGISHIASTPRTSSTDFNGEHRHSLSQRVFPSYACDFLDDDPAYEHCSTNTPPGSLSICRHSPRLLSNGYYIWTEDSFLSDEEGNITLTPSQTSVTYKENLVRVFRRRKKIRRSLASLFSLDASTSCSSTIPSNVDSSHLDDPWPDECNELEASQSDVGDSNVSSEYNSYDSHVSQRQAPAPNSKEDNFLQPEKPFCVSKSSFPFMINANEDLEQCRYFLGGLSATLLLIILVFLLSKDAAVSSFFSLDTSFRTTEFCSSTSNY